MQLVFNREDLNKHSRYFFITIKINKKFLHALEMLASFLLRFPFSLVHASISVNNSPGYSSQKAKTILHFANSFLHFRDSSQHFRDSFLQNRKSVLHFPDSFQQDRDLLQHFRDSFLQNRESGDRFPDSFHRFRDFFQHFRNSFQHFRHFIFQNRLF